ncbi:MAG: hypothetical protein JOZ53_25690 [Planctomycetaceae bacterium]|nr:hypothetical protein [Planctomycetaceae bacterium]
MLPEIFDLRGLFRQPPLISVHDDLAITVENAEVEHVVHGGHDDQILALCRDTTYVVE